MRTFLFAILGATAIGSAAFASESKPVMLTDNQMDGVTAGQTGTAHIKANANDLATVLRLLAETKTQVSVTVPDVSADSPRKRSTPINIVIKIVNHIRAQVYGSLLYEGQKPGRRLGRGRA